jgi:hypothetical protein
LILIIKLAERGKSNPEIDWTFSPEKIIQVDRYADPVRKWVNVVGTAGHKD